MIISLSPFSRRSCWCVFAATSAVTYIWRLPPPETLTVGGITLDDDARAVTVNDEPVSLTPLEYDILKFLMQHPCKVFSPQEIYRQVWREPPAAENSVAVHIRHIREKIEVDPSNPRYVTVVWGKGYKIEAGV